MSSMTSPLSTVTKEDLEAILDSLIEGIVTLNDEGTILGINRAACDMLEIARDEALRANCCELLGQKLCQHAASVRESIRRGTPVRDVQVEVQTNSGRQKVLSFQTNLLRSTSEQARGLVVVFRDLTELVKLRADLTRRFRLENMVGKSKSMQEIFRLIEEVADSDATVLIQGESGTGKELVARAIHQLSPRREQPFVAVNCSAFAQGVLESELFGHVEGAFTGAQRSKRGRFEMASGGTIFLDEIGDIAPEIQVKLLRVLQERMIERVGDEAALRVDIRVISATHRPLAELVATGRFRQDLYYRLRVVPLELPPLRTRRDDLPLLAQHFVDRFRQETGRPIDAVHPDALTAMLDYPWPGNVRELENAIEYAFVKARGGLIGPEHLPPEILTPPAVDTGATHAALPAPHRGPPAKLEPDLLRETLTATNWNVAQAARRLGVSRTTLYKRLSELRLQRPLF